MRTQFFLCAVVSFRERIVKAALIMQPQSRMERKQTVFVAIQLQSRARFGPCCTWCFANFTAR